ncbi:Arc family DNA-binding protein [Massilia sp. P8910]|uniref:Arc family DNA-binding protein n=1 Tax=Massilia antarctica TaxID=2765360 RepID=UPI001E35F9E7|nr:Arc family DNA-binding protein [Massilia antarctica]MCE3605847.1 Arc family DNA-binding protein [Massilia antarctica]
MDEIYRSQFRLPWHLYEKLKAAADQAGRSVNSELVVRLEQSLDTGSDEADVLQVFEIIKRLSERNPHLRYSFSFGNEANSTDYVATALPDAALSNKQTRKPKP